jgi:hypothetical protein
MPQRFREDQQYDNDHDRLGHYAQMLRGGFGHSPFPPLRAVTVWLPLN